MSEMHLKRMMSFMSFFSCRVLYVNMSMDRSKDQISFIFQFFIKAEHWWKAKMKGMKFEGKTSTSAFSVIKDFAL